MLTTLRDGYRAAVFGASGGIGRAIVERLATDRRCAEVLAGGRRRPADHGKVTGFTFDLTDERGIEAVAEGTILRNEAPDLVLVATGLLHDADLQPEKTIRTLSAERLARSFAVNAIGPALIAKTLALRLPRDRKSIFAALSARVSSISDNRLGGWHGYRASKAALNMLVRNLAIEVAVRNRSAVCLTLHPGTVDTGLSRPFQAGVAAGRMFTPAYCADRLLAVMEAAGPADSGKLLAWDGSEIPF